jgi:uncharacterized RDD family membrane protein YckC
MSVPISPRTLLLLLTAAVFAAAGGARAVAAAAPNLQAHGSEKRPGADERMWLARVEPSPIKPGAEITTLFVREMFKDEWRRTEPMGVRVAGLGSRGSQLAILLPGGDWRLTTDTGLASGRPVPFGGKILALGGNAGGLWAVGEMPKVEVEAAAAAGTRPGSGTTTRAATDPASQPVPTQPAIASPAPTTATTAPTSNPAAGPTLRLFRLGAQAWEDQGPLPDGLVAGADLAVSLGVASGVPMLAHQAGPREIHVHRFAAGQSWQLIDTVVAPLDVTAFKLLGGTAEPVLWFRGATGPGRLWMHDASGGASLRELSSVPAGVDHAVAFANGAIRVLWIADDKIFDQRLSSTTGQPDGDPTPLPLPAVSIYPQVSFWAQLTLTSALVFALAASLRRRREMQEIELDPAKIPLAPFSTRAVAGLIDAAPLLITSWLTRARQPADADLRDVITFLVGIGTYVLWTTLFEAIAGRSLGKLLTGLYVVGLDGKRASLGARVIRNVLRIIDIPVMPLALILFSPLRQRAGDLAAGTMVVQGKPGERSRRSDKDDDNEDDADKEGDRESKKDADA